MEQNLTLSSIVRDPALQVREHLDGAWVIELTELYRGQHEVAAVEVVFDGVRYLLTDGWHRIEAQQCAWGADALIAADVIDASALDDPYSIAKTRAAMSNRAGGLRRTDGDKRKQVVLLRSTPAGRKMTHDEIAKRVGVSRSRVTQILSGEANVSVNMSPSATNISRVGAPRGELAALWVQVDASLRADPGKPDTEHARECGCGVRVVRKRRKMLGVEKSDSKRWHEIENKAQIVAALNVASDLPNSVIARQVDAHPVAVGRVRAELGLPPSNARGRRVEVPLNMAGAPPSAPVNPKRTDDPREQGTEVLPSRPPPSKKPDIVTETLQRLETAHPTDRQAVVTAIWKRWPHMIKNAIEEEREETVVLQ